MGDNKSLREFSGKLPYMGGGIIRNGISISQGGLPVYLS